MPTSGTTIELIDDQFPKDDSASSGIVDEVDLTEANILATGLNKKAPRIVNGFGSLMGSKEMVSVEFDKKGNEKKSNLDRLLEKDNQEKEEAKTKIHISEQPWTLNNWHQHLNWLNVVLVCGMPMIGCTSLSLVKYLCI